MEKSTIIIGIVQSLIALIPTLILLWKTHEKKRASLAVRILRKKKEIEKVKIDNQAIMEKLQLELKSLEEEAEYQTRMSKWESGEWNPPGQNNIGGKISGLTNKLSDLKNQGGEIIQKGNKAVEDLISLKNKGLEEIDKGLNKVKGIGEQFKSFKDKIPNLKKEEKGII